MGALRNLMTISLSHSGTFTQTMRSLPVSHTGGDFRLAWAIYAKERFEGNDVERLVNGGFVF